MRPPTIGWLLVGGSFATAFFFATVIFRSGLSITAVDARACRTSVDSIRSALDVGLSVRLPDGRLAWIAPPVDPDTIRVRRRPS